MTNVQLLITLGIFSVVTILTRFVVFWVFPANSQPPQFVRYLGIVLPPAAIGLLVVYALKDTHILTGSHGIPEVISLLLILGIHLWRRNTLLSISTGIISYMFLVQVVF